MRSKELMNLYQDVYFELRQLEDKDTPGSTELSDMLYKDLLTQEFARIGAFLLAIENLKAYFQSQGIDVKK